MAAVTPLASGSWTSAPPYRLRGNMLAILGGLLGSGPSPAPIDALSESAALGESVGTGPLHRRPSHGGLSLPPPLFGYRRATCYFPAVPGGLSAIGPGRHRRRSAYHRAHPCGPHPLCGPDAAPGFQFLPRRATGGHCLPGAAPGEPLPGFRRSIWPRRLRAAIPLARLLPLPAAPVAIGRHSLGRHYRSLPALRADGSRPGGNRRGHRHAPRRRRPAFLLRALLGASGLSLLLAVTLLFALPTARPTSLPFAPLLLAPAADLCARRPGRGEPARLDPGAGCGHAPRSRHRPGRGRRAAGPPPYLSPYLSPDGPAAPIRAVIPPSTTNSAAVTYLASSEAR